MTSAFWTEPRIAILRAGIEADKLARDIADEIGDGCTKNMVIGKAFRLGLCERDKGKAQQKATEHVKRIFGGPEFCRRMSERSKALWQKRSYRRKQRRGTRLARIRAAEARMSA